MPTINVIGAGLVATRFAGAAAGIAEKVEKSANETARNITDNWQSITPASTDSMVPGHTSSDAANVVLTDDGTPGQVGVSAVNWSFVATKLQSGTSRMPPRVDYYGAASPHVDGWTDRVAKIAGDV